MDYEFNINGIAGVLEHAKPIPLGGGAYLKRTWHVAWIDYGHLDEIEQAYNETGDIVPSMFFNGFVGDLQISAHVPMGTRYMIYLQEPYLRVNDTDKPFLEWYAKYWKPTIAHNGDVTYRLGPKPDPEGTEATGSGRLNIWRNPLIAALAYGSLNHYVDDFEMRPQDKAEFMRWVSEQAERGVSWTRNYGLWSAEQEPDKYLGQGYKSNPNNDGGFSTHYSSELPVGVPNKTGKYIGHVTHGTIDGLVGAAILTKDFAAAEMAILTVESWASSLKKKEKWSSRAFGRFFRGLAMLLPIAQYWPQYRTVVLGYAFKALERLQDLHYRNMIAPDNGKTSESYHLTFEDVEDAFGHLGLTDEQIQDLARSDTSWMVTQTADGLMDLHELAKAYDFLGVAYKGKTLGKWIKDEVRLCAVFLSQFASKPGFDVDDTYENTPLPAVPKKGWWDDANGMGLVKGSIFQSGVGQRFLARTMARFDEFLGLEGNMAMAPLADELIDYAFETGNFGGLSEAEWLLGT